MIIKLLEYAELMLLAAIFTRFVLTVTNNDDDSVWERTEKAVKEAMVVITIHNTPGQAQGIDRLM